MSLYTGVTLEADYRQLVSDNLAKYAQVKRLEAEPTVWRAVIRDVGGPIPIVIPIQEIASQEPKDDRPSSWRYAQNRSQEPNYRRSLRTAKEVTLRHETTHMKGGK